MARRLRRSAITIQNDPFRATILGLSLDGVKRNCTRAVRTHCHRSGLRAKVWRSTLAQIADRQRKTAWVSLSNKPASLLGKFPVGRPGRNKQENRNEIGQRAVSGRKPKVPIREEEIVNGIVSVQLIGPW